jgi:hypothetical protein
VRCPGRRLQLQVVTVVCVHELTGLALGPQPTGVSGLQQAAKEAWSGQIQSEVLPLMSKQQVRLVELLLLHPTASRESAMASRII